jgi:hypothetical protein
MNRLEKYTPIAVDVVEDMFLNEHFRADKKYLTAVIDFGYSYRVSGLHPTILAFSDNEIGKSILKGIYRIILISEEILAGDETLLQKVEEDPKNRLFNKKIVDAVIALKLALRIYVDKIEKEDEDEYTEE